MHNPPAIAPVFASWRIRGRPGTTASDCGSIPAVPSTWSVFDLRGRWLGDVRMPTGFQPFEIGADYAAGIMRTNGVNQVVIYDLSVRSR
jgi:hypothetical protein